MMPHEKPAARSLFQRFSRDEMAATSVEYALIGVIMALMLVVAMPPIRDEIASIFTFLTAAFQVAYNG